jgi:glycerate 2-kinase
MRVLVAPDSFKGSLSSVQVARALAAGWRRARNDDEISLSPLADGGEGTLEAIACAGGWKWQEAATLDPLMRPIRARWLRSDDGRAAVIEMAEASGLSRVAPAERDAARASSYGTGLVIRAAVDAGVHEVMLGIGGSATTDGGAGLLRGLGASVSELDVVSLDELDARLARIVVRVACDVTNPLLGQHGAAAVYGPQKGASPWQVGELDARMACWADAVESAAGRAERDTAGAGAAGGVGFALLAIQDRFGSFTLEPGIQLVMDATDFESKLLCSGLVLTGEGRIDAQTAFGKTALGVAGRAATAGVPCIAVGGSVEAEGADALAALGAATLSVTERPISLEAAMAAGEAPVERAGERLARLFSIGLIACVAQDRAERDTGCE